MRGSGWTCHCCANRRAGACRSPALGVRPSARLTRQPCRDRAADRRLRPLSPICRTSRNGRCCSRPLATRFGLLTWSQDSFAYADRFDEATKPRDAAAVCAAGRSSMFPRTTSPGSWFGSGWRSPNTRPRLRPLLSHLRSLLLGPGVPAFTGQAHRRRRAAPPPAVSRRRRSRSDACRPRCRAYRR